MRNHENVSSFIRKLIQPNENITNLFNKCLKGMREKEISVLPPVRNYHSLQVTDTPGFSETKATTQEMVTTVVKSATAYRPKFYTFVYVMKFNGYTRHDFLMYKRFLETFGPDMIRYTITLFTGGDYLKRKNHRDELEKLMGQDFFQLSSNYIVFDNKATPAEKKNQTYRLLDKIKDVQAVTSKKPFTFDILERTDEYLRKAIKRKVSEVDKDEKEKKPKKAKTDVRKAVKVEVI